jgi:hypothetical protein
VGGVLLNLAEIVDTIANTLAANIPPQALSFSFAAAPLSLPVLDLASNVTSYVLPYSDVALGLNGYQDSKLNGPLYYLTLLALGTDHCVRTTADDLLYVFAAKSGKPYGTGLYCFSSNCLLNTFAALNSFPFTKLPTVFPGNALASYVASLPVAGFSREYVFLFFMIGPIVASFLGVWGVLAYLCCSPSRWQKVPTSCMAGWLAVVTPLYLLLSAVLVPLVFLLSDSCSTGINFGYNFILSRGDDLCAYAGGSGTLTSCTWSPSVSFAGESVELDVTLNLEQVFLDVLVECPPDLPLSGNSLAVAVTSISAQLETLPSLIVNSALTNVSALSGMRDRREGRGSLCALPVQLGTFLPHNQRHHLERQEQRLLEHIWPLLDLRHRALVSVARHALLWASRRLPRQKALPRQGVGPGCAPIRGDHTGKSGRNDFFRELEPRHGQTRRISSP